MEDYQPTEYAKILYLAIANRTTRRLDELHISPKDLRPEDLSWLFQAIASAYNADVYASNREVVDTA